MALGTEAGAAVWARLLGVAADRVGIADDLLWPLVAEPTFVSVRGLARDAIIYLAAIYPFRSLDDRKAFETRALADGSISRGDRPKLVAIPLGSLLVTGPGGRLGDRRDARATRRASGYGRLRGNPAFLSIQTGVGSADDITDRFLERDGVDLEREPDRSVRAASRALEDALKPGEMADTAEGLAALWRLTTNARRDN